MDNIFLHIVAAFTGTVAFSLLFHVDQKHFPLCGAIGAAGWLCFLLLRPYLSTPEASFFATMLVVVLSRFFSIRMKCPVTVFLIAGILPLVPGAGVYWTAYYAITEQADLAIGKGLDTIQIAVAIVLGIIFILEIPVKVFKKGKTV
ncbi:MAG: threonine/serine exporter family protein [Angelakisella sp.]